MNVLKKLHSGYIALRYNFPIWLDSRLPQPYLRIWKHRFLTHSEKAMREAIIRLYELQFGHGFDFDHPVTYNEKIQWLKLYGNIPLETRLADKYLVREYVKEKIGEEYLVPLYGVWNCAEQVDIALLPSQFVLKANHGSGMNLIVRDKSKLDVPTVRKTMKKWLKANFAWYTMELQYRNIPPRLIAEKYLENENGDLFDYKIWCFEGKAQFIMFLSERAQGLKMAFYDTNWQKLPFVYNYPRLERDVPRPEKLEEMIEKAEILAQGFPHVRVDFYCPNDGQIQFGELTFSSFSGFCRWEPPEYDAIIGNLFLKNITKNTAIQTNITENLQ